MKKMPVGAGAGAGGAGDEGGVSVVLSGATLWLAILQVVTCIVSGAFLMNRVLTLQLQLVKQHELEQTHRLAAEDHRLAAEACLASVQQQQKAPTGEASSRRSPAVALIIALSHTCGSVRRRRRPAE